ncbi:MAG: TRAP transporter large permease [Synergistaceae bacterium]|jgi:C4-dicarboxylate transporter DctM subunit|nr:TRAP transporter large permease [Synergistaceae bacterium]
MEPLLLMGLFFAFLASSLHIAVAIGLAVITFTFFYPIGNLSFIALNMYTGLYSFPLLAIPFFCLVGSIMEGGGLSSRLVNVASRAVGNKTSGLAIVTILACLFFGAISGSAPATVAAIGSIMFPEMQKHGYHREFAAGLIATAGGLGIIIPPSVPMVVYGVGTQTSIGDLFLCGIIPGVICGAFLMAVSVMIGKKRGYGGSGEKISRRETWRAVWDAKWALALPVIILGGIYNGIFTPTEAGVVGCIYALFVACCIYRELTFRKVVDIFVDNASVVGIIFLTFGVANSLSFLVSYTQLPAALTALMTSISQNKYVVLAIINVFLLIVGMLMDTMSANLIFSPLLLAIVLPLGVDRVHFGIIVTINLALGFVTPPMATNLYLTSALTKVPVPDVVRESLPFIAAMIAALFLVTYIPDLSTGILKWVR